MIDTQREAFTAMNLVQPVWSGFAKVSNILGVERRVLLHAGPPFAKFEHIPQAVLNSLCIGALFEGWANSVDEAIQLVQSKQIEVLPAQNFGIVVPLAGVVSPSMCLLKISDKLNSNRVKYSVLNEGMTLCTRLGILDTKIVDHLRWLNNDFSVWLQKRFKDPIDLSPVIIESLLNGDDCHARTMHGSKCLANLIYKLNPDDVPGTHKEFLDGSLAFALNFWMAMASLVLSVSEEYPKSRFLSKVGGNGYEIGVQLSCQPGVWLTSKAPTINGKKEERFSQSEPLGSIGDSPVVDFLGLGGQVLDLSIASAKNLQTYLPQDYAERAENISFDRLSIFGNRYGVSDIYKIIKTQKGPLVLLGMIDSAGVSGRIGGGVLDTPIETINELVKDYL